MEYDELIEHVRKMDENLSNQQQTVRTEFEQVNTHINQRLVPQLNATIGAIQTLTEFITDESPDDDQHVVKLDEVQKKRTQLESELKDLQKRLGNMLTMSDNLNGALGVTRNILHVYEHGTEEAPAADADESTEASENV